MRLRDLIDALEVKDSKGGLDVDIKDIAYDSRRVRDESLFIAVKGYTYDGHSFIQDAIKRGARAIVGERFHQLIVGSQPSTVLITVPDSRRALALLSDRFYGHPSGSLRLIGITGTNGKTTTSYLVREILIAAGKKVGLLGTINYIIKNEITLPAPYTTPESVELQGYLRDMVVEGMGYAVLEVSSHSLALDRVLGCEFEVALFTNLSRDHLDFHVTMEEYLSAKKRLFDYLTPEGTAVINIDLPEGRDLMKQVQGRVLSFGLEDAHIKASRIRSSIKGIFFEIQSPYRTIEVESPLSGIYNIYNILGAAGVALSLGISPSAVAEGIRRMKGVPGRFEKIEEGQDFTVVVDYAHTEEALRRVLTAARGLIKEQRTKNKEQRERGGGKIITVFGCGGDRDRGKRPKMGEAASTLSDFVIITSDNPRSEDPLGIIKEIEKGITQIGLNNYIVIPDRKEAIGKAIEIAERGDFVLIAGKGHEDYQIIKGVRYPFDDRKVAREAIQDRVKAQGCLLT